MNKLRALKIKLTIYAALRNRLGREPTHDELVAEVKRIIKEGNKSE